MANTETSQKSAAAPLEGTPPAAGEEKNGKSERKPYLLVGVAVLVVVALFFGVRAFLYGRDHAGTDDAYITGDLVNVSPLISGTLQHLTVQEGDFVKKGQVIARLDPSGPESSVRQAQANYRAALTQVPAAEKNLAYEEEATKAAIQKAQSGLNSQRAKTEGAAQQVTLTSSTVQNQVLQARAQLDAATAQWEQAKAQVQSAISARDSSQQAVQTAIDSLANFEQQVTTAQRAAQSAAAKVTAAQAVATKTSHDEARVRTLYQEDAVSAQTFDSIVSNAQSAAAQLTAAQADAGQAVSAVESARRAANQARSQVEQARKTVAQGDAQVVATQRAADASREQVSVARAGLGIALANTNQVGIQRSNLASTSDQTSSAEADIATAKAGQRQVEVRRQQVATYRAQAAQAKAALTNAQITLGDTYIYAPCDGEVVRKDSNDGATMSPGTTVVTITRNNQVWVMANFKETQLQDVRVGQPAEIDVDAFPGKKFQAKVTSIAQATGAATALLPPDNATGNFTKVVQRIPVRLEFLPAAPGGDPSLATADDIANLRQGMSVITNIDTSNHQQAGSGR